MGFSECPSKWDTGTKQDQASGHQHLQKGSHLFSFGSHGVESHPTLMSRLKHVLFGPKTPVSWAANSRPSSPLWELLCIRASILSLKLLPCSEVNTRILGKHSCHWGSHSSALMFTFHYLRVHFVPHPHSFRNRWTLYLLCEFIRTCTGKYANTEIHPMYYRQL